MPMPRANRLSPTCVGALVVVTLSVLATVMSAAAQDAAAPGPEVEPPLRFDLSVGEKTVAVTPGEPFTVELDGKAHTMTLTARPTRVFDRFGMHFEYPSHHAYEYDGSTPGVRVVSLDGSNSVIMVFHYTLALKAAELRPVMVAEVTQQFAAGRVERSPAKLTLAGKVIEGDRISVEFAGEKLQQDIFLFDGPGGTMGFMLQDSLDDNGGPTKEALDARRVLEKTFKFATP